MAIKDSRHQLSAKPPTTGYRSMPTITRRCPLTTVQGARSYGPRRRPYGSSLTKYSVGRCARPSLRAEAGTTLLTPCTRLILVSRKVPRDRAQQLLFEHHRAAFPDENVPLLYRPRDTRKQNVLVTILGPQLPDEGPDQQKLVLNDVIHVPVLTAQEVLDGKWGDHWTLGCAMTVHSPQGLTIEDPRKVWIVDDYLQWSNLAYLAVSRVRHLHLLTRCCPPAEANGPPPPAHNKATAQKNIARKLQAYKRLDAAVGLQCNLHMKDIEGLKKAQESRCAACNIEMLWCYVPKDTRQFSIDRIDNAQGHAKGNVLLTCLECNRKRGGAVLNA